MTKVKAWLDKHVERFISRKFLAWGLNFYSFTNCNFCLYFCRTRLVYYEIKMV